MPQMAIVVVIGVFFAPSVVFGWGQTGHRIVGEVARRHLSPDATAKVTDLLGGQSLAAVSTWPDDIRSDARWDCAKPFHFVTVPPKKDYPEGAGDVGDLVKAIVFYASVLSNAEGSADEQAQALKFLVHFLGDIHQPLHIGLGCDFGGNTVRVEFFGSKTKLHSVWDAGLIEATNLSFSEFASFIDHAPEEHIYVWQNSSPLDWVAESQSHLDQAYTCYTNLRGDGCSLFCGQGATGKARFGGCPIEKCITESTVEARLAYEYAYHNKPVIEGQLLRSGIRLAGMLNWIFSTDKKPPQAYLELKTRIENMPNWDAPMKKCTGEGMGDVLELEK